MNDPNGLFQWKGQYHLFYQYNPNGPFHRTIHWGHAVSPDLAHWTHLPAALAPTPGGPDQNGCWSGCMVDNDGTPTMIYTGVQPQAQCLAWSDDDLLTWKKYPGNPVLPAPPPHLDLAGHPWDWRDPWVWRDNGLWYLLVGSGIRNAGGTALLYQSPDLLQWEYLQPILIGNQAELGEVWECPNLFRLGEKHVLLVSVIPEFRHTYYLVGAYADHTFTPETVGKTDFGPYFYAALTMLDDQGRRLMWGWLKEGRADQAQRAAGWAGVMSLPRILSTGPGGILRMAPVPELEALRDRHYAWTDVTLTPDSAGLLNGVPGNCLEIMAEFEPAETGQFGFWTHSAPDKAERTLIAYDFARQCLAVDRSHSSLSTSVDREIQTAPLPLAAGELLSLHIFIDGSVIEVFGGSRVCLTSRVYPTRPDSSGLEPTAFNGCARLKSLDVWTMSSIWTTSPGPSGRRSA
jgi:beta-fructofuranosidase